MELFLHIGFPKTGNTTFHHLLQNSKEINYVGQRKNQTYREIVGVFNSIWQSMIFDSLNNFKKKIKDNKANIILELSSSKKNILIIEGITDFFFYYTRNKDFLKRLKLLEKKLLPQVNLQLILMLKNQPDFIISRYVESPEFFHDLKKDWIIFENLLTYFTRKKSNKYEKLFFEHLKYSFLIKKLLKLFSKKKISIFLYEELNRDTKNFAKKFSNLLDLPNKFTYNFLKNYRFNKSNLTNESGYLKKKIQITYKITNNMIYRRFGKYIPLIVKYTIKSFLKSIDRLLHNISPANNSIIRMTTIEKKIIQEFYFKDNNKLNGILKIDLKKYEYY